VLKQIVADKSGTPVEVNTDAGEDTGLVVATRPHKTLLSRTTYAINSTYGREMAQDGAYGAIPLVVHNGTDDVAWTMSEPVGTKWVDNSTDQFYAGTKSMLCDNPSVGAIMQVINNDGPGNNVAMTLTYVALTCWIYVDIDWVVGDSFSVYAHVDGALAGNAVLLEDYFDFESYDRWQYVNIPLTDLGIAASSIDAFRIECAARVGAKSPKFWIDKLQLEQPGAPIDFEITPRTGTWFRVKSFKTTWVDAISADNADSTMPQLSYDTILGVAPVAGYVYRRYVDGSDIPATEARITSLMDLLSLPYTNIIDAVSDGTNTMVTVETSYPESIEAILKHEDGDRMVFTLEDDFSGLLFFRISVIGTEEQRS
jgi:hypothetical protein